jgi:predicted protein tyrosine phosphatase
LRRRDGRLDAGPASFTNEAGIDDNCARRGFIGFEPAPSKDGMMIHVCSLARLHETVAETGARHIVSLVAREDRLSRPEAVAAENHLWLQLHDISEPLEGYVTPGAEHVEQLVAFVRHWPRETPLVVHCYAGISRSTAAAYVALCALNPPGYEDAIARALRRASPTASPNARIVALGDAHLDRDGRMVAAIAAIGPGALASEGVPFRMELAGH